MNELIPRSLDIKVSGRQINNCPFPGLRPFNSNESQLFYGRDIALKELLDNIIEKRLVVITGKSGSGKTSLLNAGLIAEFNEADKCLIVSFCPGVLPLRSLANALVNNIPTKDKPTNEKEIELLLLQNSSGLAEIVKSVLKSGQSILFVIDQFEELCKLDIASAEYFINLLIDTYNNIKIQALIVIALRSEYVEQCSQTFGINQIINSNSLPLPELSTDELRDIITLPVITSGGSIDSQLVNQIITDSLNVRDKLPKIQFALKETWNNAYNKNKSEVSINLSDYTTSGGINALQLLANLSYEKLPLEEKKTCEKILKTITTKNSVYVSSSLRISEISEITEVPTEKIIEVSDKIRLPNCPILLSSSEVILTSASELQISHQCLPYIWSKLSSWIDEEAASIFNYKALAKEAEVFQASRSELLKPPDLLKYLDWERKQKPTAAWAKKHNPAFERTMLFLSLSEQEYRKQEEKKLKLLKQRKKRKIVLIVMIIAIVIIALGLLASKLPGLLNKSSFEQNNIDKNFNKNDFPAPYKKVSKVSYNQEAAEVKENNDSGSNKTAINEEEQIRKFLVRADTLAAISLQIKDDKYLKGLLAYYAFSFYNRFSESEYSNRIFKALSEAVKNLYGDYYNVYKGHTDAVNALLFNPNNNVFYSASSDGRVAEWNINDKLKRPKLLASENTAIQASCISNNGRWLVFASSNLPLQVIDMNDTNIHPKILREDLSEDVQFLAFLPDNKHFFAYVKDKGLILWNLETGENEIFAEVDAQVSAICIDSAGRSLVIGTGAGKILDFELPDNKYSIIEGAGNQPITAISISKDGKYMVTGDKSGNIVLWNYLNLNLITVLQAHAGMVTDLKFSPICDAFVSSGMDNKVLLWPLESYSSGPLIIEEHESPVLSLSLSPDGNTIAIGSENEDRVIIKPVKPSYMADMIRRRMVRNLSISEWDSLIGKDIAYEKIH